MSEQERALIEAGAATPVEHRWPTRADWRHLLSNRTLLANYWAFFVFGYFLFLFMTWMPSYLEQEYGLDLTQVGLFAILPWLAAAAGMWIVGQMSDATLARTGSLRRARSLPIAVSQLVAALAVMPLVFSADLDVAVACITVAVGATLAANGAYYAVNVDITGLRVRV